MRRQRDDDEREPTREERLADARKALNKMVDRYLEGCSDPTHTESEKAARALIEGSHLIPLPGKVKEAFLSVYVGEALHNAEMDGGGPLAAIMGGGTMRFDKMFAKLGDSSRLMFAMQMAATIARICGVGLEDGPQSREAHAGIPVVTGQYV